MKKIEIFILSLCLIVFGLVIYNYFAKDKYITSDEAKKIAMSDVANKDGEYQFNSIEFKETYKTYIYTLKFNDKVNHYTYKINARNKKIISSKKELISNPKVYMQEDDILDIVFSNAKLNRINCNLISNLLTIEDNNAIYNTVFFYDNIRYEYKTSAYTGSIISVVKLVENAV